MDASYQGRQTLTVIGTAFPIHQAPAIGDRIDVTVPWSGRGVTVTVVELELDGDGVVRWRAQANMDSGGQMVPDSLLDEPSPFGPTYRELAEGLAQERNL